jgi:hypothetical protein
MWSWISGESLATSASPNLVSLQAQLVEGSLHIDCVPQDDHVNNEAQRTELILLSLPIALTQFAPLTVEDSATQTVSSLTSVELG